ncbi:MAG: hypothetical protein ACLTZY_02645 [Alistipes indistinctus]
MKRLFLTLAACAALCACSKDDADSQKTPVFTGDTAYLNASHLRCGNTCFGG